MSINKIESIKNLSLKTKWKPDKDFDREVLKMALASAFAGYYDSHEILEAFVKGLSMEKLSYVWNKYPDIRSGIIKYYIDTNASRHDDSYSEVRIEFISLLLSQIPSDYEIDNNRARAKLIPICKYNYDYLSELTTARILGDDNLISLWYRVGLSNSTNPLFFETAFKSIKRAKGSVDKKLSVIESMFSRGAISDTLIKELAKSGTKKMKRLAVDNLCYKINDISQKIRYNKNSPEVDSWKERRASWEDRALLFASVSDYKIVDNLSEYLSPDNLPWVMPSATSFPYLMRNIQRRIDNKSSY